MDLPTPASVSATVRCEIPSQPGSLAMVLAAIGQQGGAVRAVDLVEADRRRTVRDLTIEASGDDHLQRILAAVRQLPQVLLASWSDRVFVLHQGGKIELRNKFPVDTRDGQSVAGPPGVARVCQAIAGDPDLVYTLTVKPNAVAIVTDGSAVLGLGNLGPRAALPAMEGKAMLFKEFAGIDAWPICLDTQDADAIVDTVVRLAPGFGGIDLEGISAPRCFDIESRLRERLDIPVFHDDQHGTAVAALAGLINALKVVGKQPADIRVVISGVGAAGIACARLLLRWGVRHLVGVDRTGAIYRGRPDNMKPHKQWFAEHTNPGRIQGSIVDAARGADVFLGVSVAGALPLDALRAMAPDPIVFALATPTPEILPEQALDHARIVATGRSDYPNQISNVLAFPGIFKGALGVRAATIDEAMELAAAHAIAGLLADDERYEENIVPSVFDRRVVPAVAAAVAAAARESGVARR